MFKSYRGHSMMIYYENSQKQTLYADLAGGLWFIMKYLKRGVVCTETLFSFSKSWDPGTPIGRGRIVHRNSPRTSVNQPSEDNSTVNGLTTADLSNGTIPALQDDFSNGTSNSNSLLTFRYQTIDASVVFSAYPFIEIATKSTLALAYLVQTLPLGQVVTFPSFTGKLQATFIAFDPPTHSILGGMTPPEAREAMFYLLTNSYLRTVYEHSALYVEKTVNGVTADIGVLIMQPVPSSSDGTVDSSSAVYSALPSRFTQGMVATS